MPEEQRVFTSSQALRVTREIRDAIISGRKVIFWAPSGSDVTLGGDNHLVRLLQEHGEGKVEVKTREGVTERLIKFTPTIVKLLYAPKK